MVELTMDQLKEKIDRYEEALREVMVGYANDPPIIALSKVRKAAREAITAQIVRERGGA